MPGFCTHYQFGVNTYRILENQELKRIIHTHRHAYVLGAQGPDLFYYYPITTIGGMASIPNQLHKKRTSSFLRNMVQYCGRKMKTDDYETCVAYICGFLTHYILDTRMHPYVYAMVGTKANAQTLGEHNGLETDIDRKVLMYYKGVGLEHFDHRSVAHVTHRERVAIARLLQYGISKTYRLYVPRHVIRGSVHGFRLDSFLRMDEKHRKHRMVRFIERYTVGYPFISMLLMNRIEHSEDPCNEAHQLWVNPWDDTKQSSESVFEMMDRLAPICREDMQDFFNMMQAERRHEYYNRVCVYERIGNLSYTSGIDCEIELTR